MASTKQESLETKLEEFELSPDLIQLLQAKGYHLLGDVLQQKLSDLRNRDGLTIKDELALYKIVEQFKLEEYWKEE